MQRFCVFGDTGRFGRPKGSRIPLSEIDRVDYLLIGDSHAKALMTGLDRYFRAQGKSAALMMPLGRQPFMGVFIRSGENSRPPSHLIYPYLDQINFSHVIFAGRWSLYFNEGEAKLPEGYDLASVALQGSEFKIFSDTWSKNSEVLVSGLRQSIGFFSDRNVPVLVVGEVPYMGVMSVDCLNVPGLLIPAAKIPERCAGASRAEVDRILGPAHSAFLQAENEFPFTYMPLVDLMCDDSQCTRFYDGQPIYHDEDHVNALGAEYVTQRFLRSYLE